MTPEKIRELLDNVKNGATSVDDAMARLKTLPFEDLGFARLDHHRALRTGYPEVIYCQGKAPEHILEITSAMAARRRNVLLTRVPEDLAEKIAAVAPDVSKRHPAAKCVTIEFEATPKNKKRILIITAGTSDIPVAEEAAVTAEFMGNNVERLYDVGVAGIHRLLEHYNKLGEAGAIVVAAGMEGALASVVGGMASAPVVAVPTSVGYGASFHGLAALLGMLNTCSPGVAVVNIDNGFGAGYFAAVVNAMGNPEKSESK